MMNSRRICPTDGSQYKDSAVGLVFMESAAGLAMGAYKSAIQQMLFALKIQQSQDTSWKHMFNTSWTTRRKQQQHPVVVSAARKFLKYFKCAAADLVILICKRTIKWYQSRSRLQVGHCEAVTENKLIAQCTSRGKMKRKTKQSTAIREELSRESIAESRLAC
ncbi:hypothetical protein F511_05847 [Dorcoceras hygrometricum]|uniref:Uncharacterized protein n=1 Tax=Dorcoceras hygrometricum TaxID=472368 RepID=A0A2Z7CX09_9LAMI|nr:hypothetical protein F511_05847 [Dorcoceras hygrometricum]